MVRGLDIFQSHFADQHDHYVLIGGVACDLLMAEAGLEFRATKDLDIVLCVESLDRDFLEHFWRFIAAGGYKHQEKSTGKRQYYRFHEPGDQRFPVMLELFSRTPDGVTIEGDARLTPIPTEADAESLSAILLDEDYYACVQVGKRTISGISLLGAEYILPFKARAWLDLTERRNNGEQVDKRDIRKHRGDVFRLYQLLATDQRIEVAATIRNDLLRFVEAMRVEDGLNLKDFGLRNQDLAEVLHRLETIYELGPGKQYEESGVKESINGLIELQRRQMLKRKGGSQKELSVMREEGREE